MKKILISLMALGMAVTFVGCANLNGPMGQEGTSQSQGSGASGQVSVSQPQGGDVQPQGNNAQGTVSEPQEQSADAQNQGNVVSAEETYDAINQNAEGIPEQSWEGTYASDQGETLSVSIIDEDTISFSFANCGIGGSADVDGTSAQYDGDDDNTIVFDLAGNTISVSVFNSEGYSTEGAVMAGTYVLQ